MLFCRNRERIGVVKGYGYQSVLVEEPDGSFPVSSLMRFDIAK
jgi:hypothetical protein